MQGLKIAKLISGELVIGRFDNNILFNIMLITTNTNNITHKVSFSLTPYMSPFDLSINQIISADKIMAFCDCSLELAKEYIRILSEIIRLENDTVDENDSEINNIVDENIADEDEEKKD